jgi:hypothetical protein
VSNQAIENKSKHPLYGVWSGIKQRCCNPKSTSYHYYGGRGIKMCERWLHSFEAFVEDMGVRPEGHSIDRIDNDGHYGPSNCRWADKKTQNRNTRYNRYLTGPDGCSMTMEDWANKSGIPQYVIQKRIGRGWPEDKAVSTPLRCTQGERHYRAKLTDEDICKIRILGGQGRTNTEIARQFGVHSATISKIILGHRRRGVDSQSK